MTVVSQRDAIDPAARRRRATLAVAECRRRWKAQGLCGSCGRPRLAGRKICDACTARNRRVQAEVKDRPPIVIPPKPQAYARLTIAFRAERIAELVAFAEQWGLSLDALIEESLDAYMEGTQEAQRLERIARREADAAAVYEAWVREVSA